MKLSIIIPVYNAAPYIEKCLDSVLTQDIDDYEVITINDGSTDDSLAIMERYKSTSPVGHRLKIFTQENHGVSATRNRGIDMAQGEYITFVDADDFVLENSLSKIFKEIELLQEKPEIVFTGISVISISKPVVKISFEHSLITGNQILSLPENLNQFDSACAKFYHLDFLRNINARFDTNLVLYEDLIFNLSIIEKCTSILTLPVNFYFYNRHSGSASTKFQGTRPLDTCRAIFDAQVKFYSTHGKYEVMEPKIKFHLAYYIYF